MSNRSKKEYIAFRRLRYLKLQRKERSVILDEIGINFPIHRKSAVGIMLQSENIFFHFLQPSKLEAARTEFSKESLKRHHSGRRPFVAFAMTEIISATRNTKNMSA